MTAATNNLVNLSSALPITGLTHEERVAALADSALSEADAQAVIDELLGSSELCASWQSLYRTGDYLRSDELVAADADTAFWQRFSARLEQEPTLLAPKPVNPTRNSRRLWLRYGLPGASMAAAVALVSWVSLSQITGNDNAVVASAPAQPTATSEPLSAAANASRPVDAKQLRNYLAAHQQFSASALRGPVAVQSASFNIIRNEE